jgi:hypothetical protein
MKVNQREINLIMVAIDEYVSNEDPGTLASGDLQALFSSMDGKREMDLKLGNAEGPLINALINWVGFAIAQNPPDLEEAYETVRLAARVRQGEEG